MSKIFSKTDGADLDRLRYGCSNVLRVASWLAGGIHCRCRPGQLCRWCPRSSQAALQTRNQLSSVSRSGLDATEQRTGKTRSSNRRTASGLETGFSSWLSIQPSRRRNRSTGRRTWTGVPTPVAGLPRFALCECKSRIQAIVSDPTLRGHLGVDQRAVAFDRARTARCPRGQPCSARRNPVAQPVALAHGIRGRFIDRADRLISIIAIGVIGDKRRGRPEGLPVGSSFTWTRQAFARRVFFGRSAHTDALVSQHHAGAPTGVQPAFGARGFRGAFAAAFGAVAALLFRAARPFEPSPIASASSRRCRA